MTKEELRKEATSTVEWESTPMIDRPTFINGYIVGADPREKRIEELEKKIKQLQDDIDCLTLACENYREEMEKNLADATELEKENAELKEYLGEKENTVHTLDVLHKEAVRKYGEVNDQLTKAKEIIKELLDTQSQLDPYRDIFKDRILKADKFLKEIGESK